MAAGLGFKDFTTGEVLTAADVDGYLMQGVWVFASAAARDAAVTSPQEGNSCYLKDTDVIQVYSGSSWVTKSGGSPLTTKGDLYTFSTTDARLPVGANGTTLVADSAEATGLKWATASAGGMTLINTGGTTLTGASVTIGSIPGTYKHLQLIVRNYKPVVDEDGMAIRFNNDSTANRYMYSATNPLTTTFDESQIAIQQTQDNTNAQGFSVTDIFDYTNTTTWKCCFINYWSNNATTSTQVTYSRRFGIYNQTGAITEILIRSNSGNFTSGTAFLYGVS